MRRFSYFFIFSMTVLAALGLMSGCNKNDLSLHQLASNAIIGFDASVDLVEATKTPVNNEADLSINGDVKMYAYYMEAVDGSNVISTEYFNDRLKFSGGTWNTTTLHYWPYTTLGASPSRSISFFAYQPDNSNVTNFSDGSYRSGSGSKPSFKYTTPAIVNDQNDLLTAVSEFATYEGTGGSTNGQVGLTFEHALVKLGFVSKISGVDDPMPNVNLRSVKVMNVFPTATYSYGGGWTGWEGTKSYYEAISSPPFTLTTSSQNIMGEGQFMFLIPQSTAGISVEVQYEVDGSEKTSTVSLSHYEWTSGKGIAMELNYKIETNGSITFILNLVDWDDETINTEII